MGVKDQPAIARLRLPQRTRTAATQSPSRRESPRVGTPIVGFGLCGNLELQSGVGARAFQNARLQKQARKQAELLLPAAVSTIVALLINNVTVIVFILLPLSIILTVVMYCSFYPTYTAIFGRPQRDETSVPESNDSAR